MPEKESSIFKNKGPLLFINRQLVACLAILNYIFRFFIAFLHRFMKQIAAYVRLLRWPNLLIVFLTQLLIWACVIHPLKKTATEQVLFLDFFHFALLSLTTVFIAAAGYIINDYFDVAIDRINKPSAVIIGRLVSQKAALAAYIILNSLGMAIAVFLAKALMLPMLALFQLFCVLLLFVYAARLKRSYLSGNVVVSLLTALTIIILAAYEPALYSYFKMDGIKTTKDTLWINPVALIIVYALFAFLVTWMREIVKDIQDRVGDMAAGCRTLPIVSGVNIARRWVIVLGILVVIILIQAAFVLFCEEWIVLSVYVVAALICPVLTFLFRLLKQQEEYAKLSKQLKILMLLGIGALPVYYFLSFVFL